MQLHGAQHASCANSASEHHRLATGRWSRDVVSDDAVVPHDAVVSRDAVVARHASVLHRIERR